MKAKVLALAALAGVVSLMSVSAFADDGCSVTGLLSRRRASPRTPA